MAGLGWRSAFLINVPIGVAIVLLGRAAIAESRSSQAPTLDLVGAALTGVALPALLLPVILGHERGAPGWLWLSAVLGVVAVGVLVRQQRAAAARGGAPLFPPHVLTARGMPAGLAAIMTFFGGNAGLFLVFTYYTQTGLDHDPLAAGLMFVPLGLGFAVGSAASGRLVARFGPRLPVAGCGFLAVALLGHLAVVHTPRQQRRPSCSAWPSGWSDSPRAWWCPRSSRASSTRSPLTTRVRRPERRPPSPSSDSRWASRQSAAGTA